MTLAVQDIAQAAAGAEAIFALPLRREALLRLRRGLPSAKDEDFRYTALSSLRLAEPMSQTPEIVPSAPLRSAPVISLAGGRLVAPHCSAHLRVERGGADDIADLHRAEVALNTATLTDPITVHVTGDATLEVQLQGGAGGAWSSRIRYHVEPGSKLNVLVRVLSGDHNIVQDLDVGPGASVSAVLLGGDATGTLLADTSLALGASAQVSLFQILLGGPLCRSALRAELEANAEIHLAGLGVASGAGQVESVTDVRHVGVDAISRQSFFHLISDRATGTFNGKVTVESAALGTDAMQQNKNLLLGDRAMANTRPQLEIYADAVKCSHGATIGRLSEDALFYMQSRGIDKPTAERLLAMAFARQACDHAPEDLRGPLDAWVEDHLGRSLWSPR